jgi:hypothetical protein
VELLADTSRRTGKPSQASVDDLHLVGSLTTDTSFHHPALIGVKASLVEFMLPAGIGEFRPETARARLLPT